MRYYGTALLLGFGWFGVLLIPPTARAWMLASGDVTLNVTALLATSLVTARLFRPWIMKARSLRDDLRRAILIPCAACVIYLTLYNGYAGMTDFFNTGRINVHDSVVLYYWGLLYTILAGYVILPYSFLCQRLMKRAAPA